MPKLRVVETLTVPAGPSRLPMWFTCAWIVLLCWLASLGCGVHPRPLGTFAEMELPRLTSPEAAESAVRRHDTLVALRRDNWYPRFHPPEAIVHPGERWQHPAIDPLLRGEGADRGQLAPFVDHAEPLVAANAAIGLARLHDVRGRSRLVKAIADDKLPLAVRRAAADALASLAEPAATEDLRQVLDRLMPASGEEAKLPSELHAELLQGLAARVDAADEPRLTAGALRPERDVRRVVAQAWSQGRPASVPDVVAQLRTDPDQSTRQAILRGLAVRGDTRALEAARASLGDHELDVRLEAIAALGKIDDPAARALLEPLSRHEGEVIRAAAVAALAQQGAEPLVATAANDKSWRVRLAVASTLRSGATPERQALALRLIVDRSSEVQQETLAALESWPLPAAGPVLLASLEGSGYQIRRLASVQLARRWPPAGAWSLDAPTAERQAKLVSLRERWEVEFPQSLADPQQSLASAGPVEWPSVEELAASDVHRRRSAAARLRTSASGPLPEPLIETLARLAPQEQDPLVWRDWLASLNHDDSPAARSITRSALALPNDDVRQWACTRLVERPDPDAVSVLLTLVKSAPVPLARAVVAALEPLDDPRIAPALNGLLGTSDKSLRLAAAEILARRRVESAREVIVRLIWDPDPVVARAAIEAAGRIHDPRFLGELIGQLERGEGVGTASLTQLATLADDDPTTRLAAGASTRDRIAAWQDWWRERSQPTIEARSSERAEPAERR